MNRPKELDYIKVWAVYLIGNFAGVQLAGYLGGIFAGHLQQGGVSLETIRLIIWAFGMALACVISYILLRFSIGFFIVRKMTRS